MAGASRPASGPSLEREVADALRRNPQFASSEPGRWIRSGGGAADPAGGGARVVARVPRLRPPGRRRPAGDRQSSRARWTRASPPATTSSPTPTAPGSRPPRSRRARSDGGAATRSRPRTAAASPSCSRPPAPRPPARRRARWRTSSAAYLNEAAIEARGLASLQPLLDRVEKVSDKAELTRLLGRSMRADVDPMGFGVYKSAGVLGLSVEQSIHGEKTNTAFLVQGGLGLPDREDYLSADPGEGGASSAVSRIHPDDAHARWLRTRGRTRRRGAGAGNGDRAKPGHARGVGQRPQCR